MTLTITIDIPECYHVALGDFLARTISLKSKKAAINIIRRKAQHAGCYAIFFQRKCLYVGQSKNNVSQRVWSHFRRYPITHNVDRVLQTYAETDLWVMFWRCDRQDSEVLELYLIKTLHPLLNSRGCVDNPFIDEFQEQTERPRPRQHHENQADKQRFAAQLKALSGKYVAKI